MKSTRRSFLRGSVALAAAVAACDLTPVLGQVAPSTAPSVADLLAQMPQGTRRGDMIFRKFGKTDHEISLIGLGGAHIGRGDEEEMIRLMRTAIDRGITFMDNCWDYANGQAEVRMGKALRDGYRDKVFLMTKFDGRTKAAAAKQIDESLQRLQTDHVELMQFHEAIHENDTERFFGEGGGAEALREAQKAGKVKYLGFTGHKDPSFHLKMIEEAKKHDLRWDATQMPVNVLDAHYRSFAGEMFPIALREGMAVLAMKTFAGGALARANLVTPIQCLQFAMCMPSSTVITGMESMERLDQAIEAVKTFKPWTPQELAAVLDKTRTAAANGSMERFKTTVQFDGTTRNPQWMG